MSHLLRRFMCILKSRVMVACERMPHCVLSPVFEVRTSFLAFSQSSRCLIAHDLEPGIIRVASGTNGAPFPRVRAQPLCEVIAYFYESLARDILRFGNVDSFILKIDLGPI